MSAKRMTIPLVLILSVATLALAALPGARSTFRSCGVALGSEVCTWIVMEGEDAVELGATVPLALIEAVPSDAEMVWPPKELLTIALPAEARTALGIDHMAINWEAHGHPPATFLAPHFDFHFYNVTRDRVEAIDCTDTSKPPTLPAGYALPDLDIPGMGVLVGLCVPRMGMHAMAEGHVGATDTFGAAMMLGYYGGEPVFFEPMVSQARLLEASDFSVPIPRVENLPDGVRYPGAFRAEYDAAAEAYRLLFTEFGGH